MTAETTYTNLRGNLARTLDRVVNEQEIVIVRRKSARDVALVPATELAGLIETAHLLRSPQNTRRLLAALRRAERGGGTRSSVETIRRRLGDGRKKRP